MSIADARQLQHLWLGGVRLPLSFLKGRLIATGDTKPLSWHLMLAGKTIGCPVTVVNLQPDKGLESVRDPFSTPILVFVVHCGTHNSTKSSILPRLLADVGEVFPLWQCLPAKASFDHAASGQACLRSFLQMQHKTRVFLFSFCLS